MVIFHGYASLPEGIPIVYQVYPHSNWLTCNSLKIAEMFNHWGCFPESTGTHHSNDVDMGESGMMSSRLCPLHLVIPSENISILVILVA